MIKGCIVHRVIRGKDRYYHQWREGGQTHSRYLKADEVLPLREALNAQRGQTPELGGQTPKTGGQTPEFRGTDPLGEIAYGVRKLSKRAHVDDIVDFIRNQGDARILILHGLPGSGKTTIIRQALGQLTAAERADICLRTLPFATESYRPLTVLDTTALSFRDFAALEKTSDILAFIERGGSPSNPFSNTASARAFVDPIAGADGWRTLEDLTLPFLLTALTTRTPSGAHHARTRAAVDRQKLMALLDDLVRQRPADPNATARLTDLGLLVQAPVDVLRPEFSQMMRPFFTQPGLRFCVARHLLITSLESKPFAALGAAERKMLRDQALAAVREQILEDAVYLETRRRLASDDLAVVRVEAGANRLGMVVADRNDLTCELYETRLTDTRDLRHLVHFMDYRFLDALEHRYGTVTDRIVLYNGRDARHPSGVSYRNVSAFLTRP